MRRVVGHKNIILKFFGLIIATVSVAVLLGQSVSAGPNDGFRITLDTTRTAPQTTTEGGNTVITSSASNVPMYHFISGSIPLNDTTAGQVTVTLVNDDGTRRSVPRAGSTPGVPTAAGGFTTAYSGNQLQVRGLDPNKKYIISVSLNDSRAADVLSRLTEISRVCGSGNISNVPSSVIDKVGNTVVDGQSTCNVAGSGTAPASFLPRLATFNVGSATAPAQTGPGGLVAVTASKAIVDESQTEADAEAGETCVIQGIGWIICPVANFMAEATDGAYTLAESLLVFRVSTDPFSTDPSINPVYTVWSNLRNLANIAFIFVFFAIIFSQATSMGIANYGIKKMLPRLIVAAILVNLSYYICVFAVDISNIIGSGLDSIIKSVPLVNVPDPENSGFRTIMSSILAGGAALGIAGVMLFAATGTVFAFVATALAAVLVAVLVLAARQAFLIILIIISPLAFVAYILPNTEGLFDKWRKIFTALLIMYPLIAIIFAGSQIASDIMFATAPDEAPGSWILPIAALGVLFIPLFVLPFLIKFSGGLIGRVAGIVNDRNKGVIDRSRKFGNGVAERNRGNAAAKLAGNKWKDQKGTTKAAGIKRALGRTGSYVGGFKAQRENQIREQQRSMQSAQERAIAERVGSDDNYARRAAGVGGDPALARVRANANQVLIKQSIEEQQAYIPNLNRNGAMLAAYGFRMDQTGNLSHIDAASGTVSTGAAATAELSRKLGPSFTIDTESAESLKFSTQNQLTNGNENGAKALATVLAKTGGLDSEMARNLAVQSTSNPVERSYVVSKMNEEAGAAGLKHLSYNTVDASTGDFVLGGQFGGVDGVVKRLMQNGASTITKEAYVDQAFGTKFAAAIQNLEATQLDTFRSELVKMDPRKIEYLAEAKQKAGIVADRDAEIKRLKDMREIAVGEFGLS